MPLATWLQSATRRTARDLARYLGYRGDAITAFSEGYRGQWRCPYRQPALRDAWLMGREWRWRSEEGVA